MICPGCQRAADQAKLLVTTADHDPAACRDLAIQPHGCTCQHDKGVRYP